MTRLLRKGDRIRLKVRTAWGWKGEAIVVRDQLGPDDIIAWRRIDDENYNRCPGIACRHEVSLIKNPN